MSTDLLHRLFDESAKRYPDRDAFSFKGDSITYAELSRASDSVAAALSANGVERGDRVGLLMTKSLRCAASVFGILKAGAAYVSIDPRSHHNRVAQLISDCDMRAVITESRKLSDLETALQRSGGVELVVGPEVEKVANTPCLPWADATSHQPIRTNAVSSSTPAYIIYTSGSTGEPKGIVHTHASATAYATCAADLYGLVSTDRLSNHSPLHFDMSTFDYFAGPSVGATTVIIPESHMVLPASLAELIEKESLTVWYSVPGALVQLLTRGSLEIRNLEALRWILYGGEPFPVKFLRQLMTLLPNCSFANVYGPAEVNQCTHYSIPKPELWHSTVESTGVPIGSVWPAAEGVIVNHRGEIITDDAVGELLIATDTMMQGYWAKPELTDACIESRIGVNGVTRRFYRTGDLVKRGADYELLFVGRKDWQVKVRGHRVELAAVEAALINHQSIDECAVVAPVGPDGTRRIVAYVTASDAVSASEIKGYLRTSLPVYAVPDEIKFVSAFARTSTGKIDRTVLNGTDLRHD